MNSSSPPPFAAPLQTRHDVFISFRGEGTCDTFASHLHAALGGKNIETYIDTRPEKGDDIGPAHMEAIEKSKISVVIFSKNYASSAWCLKELVHILGCKERYGQIVIPIFYGVDQSYVREKKGTYALAGRRLKKRFKGNMDEVPNWRDALEEAANMPEFHYSSKTGRRTEADFVEKVVRDVLAKLNRELSSDLRVPFGIESKIEKIQAKYDVFLSFRGEDTRLAFTSHLHKALVGKKIETYIDDRLVRGDEIAPALLDAIARSTISVIIFSEKYASSTWCLKELVHILGCKKRYGQIVLPIFYRIDPSDLRNKKGTYALALDELEKRFKGSTDEVVDWRDALKEAANISGFHYYSSEAGRTEADFVEEVVQDVLTKLKLKSPGDLKDSLGESSSDLKGLVGIQRKIEEIESLLCLDSSGVCCVGIWGMGGIGKTTLADAVFHRQRQSSKFEVCCFLANVRENSEKTDGLHQLRNELLGEILNDKNENIKTPSLPADILIRLRRTKALIVLDDVNARKQLEYLVGDDDRFCQGSRIIITSRDQGLLEQRVDRERIYNVEGLGSDEGLELFHSHAFRDKSPTTDYTELSREVVEYIKGIPLALKVMGSSFRRCNSKQEWEDQWKKVKEFPNEEINQVLRISYDGLGKYEKEIFLDIACFHKGFERNFVKEVLDGSAFRGKKGIDDLIDRSLISISYSNDSDDSDDEANKSGKIKELIKMHDLVEEMGKAIAQEQGSRLLKAKDVNQLLANNQSDGHVQAICIDDWHEMEYANFEKMRELRLLCVSSFEQLATSLIGSLGLPNSLRYLDWYEYPLKSLPSKFSAQNLVVLEMSWSQVEGQLWNEDQSPVNLKWIDLARSEHLTKVPDLSRSRKIEHIKLSDCKRLVEIPSYFQHLSKLTYLDLGWCTNLKNLPEMPCNLEFLNLSNTRIEELPSSVWSHEKISRLDITYCGHLKSLPSNTCKLKHSLSLEGCKSLCEFWELPRDTTELALTSSTIKELRNASIESAVGLTLIKVTFCESLVSLPTNIWKLKSLKSLDLRYCSNFQNFPEISEVMEYLEFLNLSNTAVKELPPSIRNLVALQELDLHNCKNLEVVPDELFCLTSLQVLNLSCTEIKSLPASIKQAAQLSLLFLNGCKSLESLPELPPSLKKIAQDGSTFSLNLSGTAVKELPPSIGNLVALRELDLHNCKNLEVVPDELFCIISLQKLNLSSTKIKSLPASIKQAAQLSLLFLNGCESLESLPELPPSLKTIGRDESTFSQGLQRKHMKELPTNKKCLDIIDLSGCSKLYFPEILEPMKHLEFLNLSGTAVKELPPSIGNLVALQELDLHNCKNLEVIPDDLFCITSLQKLNLSSNKIKSLPASIKQAAQLSHMFLSHCKSLESLPELPPLLQCLDAGGCTSLKTVSSSSSAITQGWEKYKFSQWLREEHIFSDCRRLDENARSNIMGDAQLKIMRMATAWSKFKEDRIEEKSYKESSVGIRCCGNEIPKWFSHKSEGCSIKIELPRDWFSTDFLGFALSLVVDFAPWFMEIRCKYNFKTSNGESHEVNHLRCNPIMTRSSGDSPDVFVWWYSSVFEEVVEGAQSPTAFYKLVTEVNVDFTVRRGFVKVKKCGICLLYGKDAEMIKQRAVCKTCG